MKRKRLGEEGSGSRSSVTIYVLECEKSKYYIGKTKSVLPLGRVLDHFEGHGSEWTTRYPPVRVIEMLPNCSDFDEDKHTKEYMAMYGIDNVRGGTYCQVELAEETVRFLEKEIRGAQDACLRCGRTSHYVGDCFARTDARGNPIVATSPGTGQRYGGSFSVGYSGGGRERSESPGYYYSDDSDGSSEEDDGACFRCGRLGHWVQDCYARTDVNGYRL